MDNLIIERWDINAQALDAELRAALGEKVTGISTGPYGVIVHLVESDADDKATAIMLVEEHNSDTLTDDQQAEADELAALEEARAENKTALNVDEYAEQDKLIQALAAKISWLEKEINFIQDL